MNTLRSLALIFALLPMIALAGDGLSVSQNHRAFDRHGMEMMHGQTVTFSNDDEFVHQLFVKGGGFSFESDEQRPGQTVRISFPTAGTFDVLCHIHPKMALHVEVH